MTATLARIEPQQSLARFQPANLEQAIQVSDVLSRSGLLPDHLRGKPADVLATILAGAELGLGMMQSFRAVYLVKGKVGFYADFLQAKARQHQDCLRFEMVESTNTVATFVTERRGQAETRLSFTIEDARQAGLTSNSGYQKQPAAMLRARCVSALCRLVYPDTMFGTYSKEEIEEMEAQEKELNPAPPFSRPDGKPPERPAVQGGVRSVVEKLKAKKEAQAPLIVDVAEGESEEEAQAKAKDVGPCIEGGQLDGTPIMNLTTDELLTIASKTENYLRANPNGKHAGLMRRNMLAVSSEIDTRAQAESEVTPQ